MIEEARSLLPQAQYERHADTMQDVLELLKEFVEAYWHDYPAAGAIRKRIEETLPGSRTHFNNGPSRAHLFIYLSDKDDYTLTLPRSEAGVVQMQRRLETAVERIRSGRTAIADWASCDSMNSQVHNLTHILHHLDRHSEDKEDLLLADRFAILRLAAATEKPLEGRSFEQLLTIAMEHLAAQRDRWSRRSLNRLGIQRSRNLLHADRGEDAPPESVLPIETRLPESVMNLKNAPLHSIVDIPGGKALGLKITRITRNEGGMAYLHTDAWKPSNLAVLRIPKKKEIKR